MFAFHLLLSRHLHHAKRVYCHLLIYEDLWFITCLLNQELRLYSVAKRQNLDVCFLVLIIPVPSFDWNLQGNNSHEHWIFIFIPSCETCSACFVWVTVSVFMCSKDSQTFLAKQPKIYRYFSFTLRTSLNY